MLGVREEAVLSQTRQEEDHHKGGGAAGRCGGYRKETRGTTKKNMQYSEAGL